ncbi:MAG: Lrp/AsnC family transcriptional regulator [Phycisphaerales bacterium]|nr:Lrp/AsnC family transcriptional regulator [Phycisphaerales bacterium]
MIKTQIAGRASVDRTASDSDRKIMAILQDNGRAIGRVFAAATDLSEATVSRRLCALEAAALVRVCGYRDPLACGCHAMSMIRFSTEDAPAAFATLLAQRPLFHRVATVAGRSEVVALVVARDNGQLLAEIDAVLAAAGSAHVESASAVLAIIPPCEARQARAQVGVPRKSALTPRQQQIEQKLIRALQSDFRATFSALSEAADLSAPAASATLQEMIAEGIIHHIVVVDPRFLGRSLSVQLSIQVRNSIEKVAQTVAKTLNPDWIFLCLQGDQIVVEASVGGEDELFRWQREINKIADVLSVSSRPFSAVYKQTFNWSSDTDL